MLVEVPLCAFIVNNNISRGRSVRWSSSGFLSHQSQEQRKSEATHKSLSSSPAPVPPPLPSPPPLAIVRRPPPPSLKPTQDPFADLQRALDRFAEYHLSLCRGIISFILTRNRPVFHAPNPFASLEASFARASMAGEQSVPAAATDSRAMASPPVSSSPSADGLSTISMKSVLPPPLDLPPPPAPPAPEQETPVTSRRSTTPVLADTHMATCSADYLWLMWCRRWRGDARVP